MDERIPKIIHYIWFGNNEFSKMEMRCKESWHRYCPDYEFIKWDESNFDISQYRYAQDAYEQKKYAFVSDVARLHILYNVGGIYMDTDVEIVKQLDSLLHHNGFSGFENESNIPTGIIAAAKGNRWIGEQLEYYKTARFDKAKVANEYETNVQIITRISSLNHGFMPNGQYQELKHGMSIYPREYFCPKLRRNGKAICTPNTYTIHHFHGSWVPTRNRMNKKVNKVITLVFGKRASARIRKLHSKINEGI